MQKVRVKNEPVTQNIKGTHNDEQRPNHLPLVVQEQSVKSE